MMAPSDDDLSDADAKKCKYCKSNVEKIIIKCNTCKGVYHQSCALRITGLVVLSGSKNLISCATCAKVTRETEIQTAINDALKTKEAEINLLRSQISVSGLDSLGENQIQTEWQKKIDI